MQTIKMMWWAMSTTQKVLVGIAIILLKIFLVWFVVWAAGKFFKWVFSGGTQV